MAKKCLKEDCNNPTASHGFCWNHQYLRTDDKRIKSKEKKGEGIKAKINRAIKNNTFNSFPSTKNISVDDIFNGLQKAYHIKRTPLKKKYKPTGEALLFDTIIKTRKPLSFLSGQLIENPNYSNVHHVLPKSKYPAYRLFDANLILLTFEEHQLVHFGTLEQKADYENIADCKFRKIYDLADELKLKYKEL